MDIPIHFALIGCGRIAIEHAKQIVRVGQLVAVVDIDQQKAEQLGLQYGVPFFSSTEQLYSAGLSFDIVVIATPNGIHAEQAIEALEHGCHVLVEKPVALRVADIILMQSAADKNSKSIFTVMQNRFNTPVKMMHQLLKEKALGNIERVILNCFWHRPSSYYTNSWHGTLLLDGGVLFTQYSHFIDLLCWFFGKGKLVEAIFNNRLHQGLIQFEDEGDLQLIFENAIPVHMQYSVNEPNANKEGSIEIIGEKGRIKAGGAYLNEWQYETNDSSLKNRIIQLEQEYITGSKKLADSIKGVITEPNDYGNYQGSMRNHHLVYDSLMQSLNNIVSYYTNIEEAKNTIELIEHIYQAR